MSQAGARRSQVATSQVRAIMMALKRSLGFEPLNREFGQMGQDIDSRVPDSGKLRFVKVRGRVSKVEPVTVHQERDSLSAQQAGGLCTGDPRVSERAGPSDPLSAAAIPAGARLRGNPYGL